MVVLLDVDCLLLNVDCWLFVVGVFGGCLLLVVLLVFFGFIVGVFWFVVGAFWLFIVYC